MSSGQRTGTPLPKLADDRRPERRRKVKEIANFLRDCLFNRTGSGEASAIWSGPIGWVVEYGYDEAAEGYQAVWCEIRSGEQVYMRNEDADVAWLESMLP